MTKTYTTQSGDTWDIISLKQYGTERHIEPLVSANWQHRAVGVFGAGVRLTIPAVTATAAYEANLPPWRRNG